MNLKLLLKTFIGNLRFSIISPEKIINIIMHDVIEKNIKNTEVKIVILSSSLTKIIEKDIYIVIKDRINSTYSNI